MSDSFTVIDDTGAVRLSGTAGAPDATAGQVLTADGAGESAWADLGTGTVTVADINAEDSSAGQVIESNGDGTASWATPAGFNGTLTAIASPPLLGQLGNSSPLPNNHNTVVQVQGPPVTVGASGPVCGIPEVYPSDVPDISDQLDVSATLYVTDAAGTNTLTVSAGNSQNTPIVGTGTAIDWSASSATIVGVDLSWDGVTNGVVSAAGGIYFVTVLANCVPD